MPKKSQVLRAESLPPTSRTDQIEPSSKIDDIIFNDWEATIERQADIFSSILEKHFNIPSSEARETKILEVGSGIGTQFLGLASKGYRITGTDLSQAAIARCKREAEKRGLNGATELHGGVDMRTLDSSQFKDAPFRIVLSADNCIPHLMSDGDILSAFRGMFSCLEPGGGLVITVRDYANESREKVQFRPYGIRERDGKKYIAFQDWYFDNQDPDVYTVSMFFVQDDGSDRPPTSATRAKYRMISVDRLMELMKEAGFEKVEQIPENGGFYQPVIIATRPK